MNKLDLFLKKIDPLLSIDVIKEFIKDKEPTIDGIIDWCETRSGRNMLESDKKLVKMFAKSKRNIHKAVKFIISELAKIGIVLTNRDFKSLLSKIGSKNNRSRTSNKSRSGGGKRTKKKQRKSKSGCGKRTKKKQRKRKTCQKGGLTQFGFVGIIVAVACFILLLYACATEPSKRKVARMAAEEEKADLRVKRARKEGAYLENYERLLMIAKLFGNKGIFENNDVNGLILSYLLSCIHNSFIYSKAKWIDISRKRTNLRGKPAQEFLESWGEIKYIYGWSSGVEIINGVLMMYDEHSYTPDDYRPVFSLNLQPTKNEYMDQQSLAEIDTLRDNLMTPHDQIMEQFGKGSYNEAEEFNCQQKAVEREKMAADKRGHGYRGGTTVLESAYNTDTYTKVIHYSTAKLYRYFFSIFYKYILNDHIKFSRLLHSAALETEQTFAETHVEGASEAAVPGEAVPEEAVPNP